MYCMLGIYTCLLHVCVWTLLTHFVVEEIVQQTSTQVAWHVCLLHSCVLTCMHIHALMVSHMHAHTIQDKTKSLLRVQSLLAELSI